jgi:hypothetical protein
VGKSKDVAVFRATVGGSVRPDEDLEILEGMLAMGEASDGHHTHNELYAYRRVYNAALFNEWSRQGLYDVHKSHRHSDGELCFGDPDWFIVVAQLPTGQISNHYRMAHWDLFRIHEREISAEYDGHTPSMVVDRITAFLKGGGL